MRRRDFIKYLGSATCAGAMFRHGRLLAAPEDYQGRLLVTVQADGAWDVSSFCDPKMNVPGALEINHWARSRDTESAGNINYAPFGGNRDFFTKYRDYMMVINGIDTQTNAHAVGVLHSWSGRNAEGFPSLPALMTSAQAPELPMSYMSFGGFSQTANLVRTTGLSDINPLTDILTPNRTSYDAPNTIRTVQARTLVQRARERRLERLAARSGLLPRQQYNLESHLAAVSSADELARFADLVPPSDQLEQGTQLGTFYINTRQQAQVAVLAFKAGVAAAADLLLPGFDTHSDHDQDHEPLLGALTDAVDYLWDYAEQQGVADRLTVVMSSDFGRTPYYNSYDGKDHWPITSAIVMEKNAPWGNRVVGLTDEGHNAFRINPNTLQRDDRNGTIIYPKHVHKALRRYLGLENHANEQGFPFNDTEDFDFFNPSLSTT
jgi:hypothetical protein